jgi:hypothetical protein
LDWAEGYVLGLIEGGVYVSVGVRFHDEGFVPAAVCLYLPLIYSSLSHPVLPYLSGWSDETACQVCAMPPILTDLRQERSRGMLHP